MTERWYLQGIGAQQIRALFHDRFLEHVLQTVQHALREHRRPRLFQRSFILVQTRQQMEPGYDRFKEQKNDRVGGSHVRELEENSKANGPSSLFELRTAQIKNVFACLDNTRRQFSIDQLASLAASWFTYTSQKRIVLCRFIACISTTAANSELSMLSQYRYSVVATPKSNSIGYNNNNK